MRFSLTQRRIHSSWLIACVAAGFLCGMALCLVVNKELFSMWLWPATAILSGIVAFVWRLPLMILAALLSGLLCGLWRGSLERISLARYKPFLDQQVHVVGTVAEDIERGNSGEVKLKVHEVRIYGIRLPGEVWVSAASKLVIKRSDIVQLEGTLHEGFGNFPASMSFASIVGVTRPDGADIARDIRDTFANGVRKVIEEPAASLGLGYLTGQQSALPAELDGQLKAVGLTHVVVASGYNLTILVRFARRIFARLSKYISTTLAGIMIGGFVLVTGFSPSMSRAALVTGLSLLLWYYGRGMHPLILLSVIAAATIAMNPLFLWGDLGWYLSFAAFSGVIILAPLVHDYFWGHQPAGMIRQILVDTSCAQLVTMPIIAFSFGKYALYALPANLLVLPFIPVTMALTFVAGIVGLVMGRAGEIAGLPAEAILKGMIATAQAIAELPGAQGEIIFGLSALVISYGVIVALCVFLWRRTKHNFRGDNIVE